MLELKVYYDEKAPPIVEKALTFETGASIEQVASPVLWCYEHHGQGFGPAFPGALTALFEDLSMGRPSPSAFVFNRTRDVDVLVAATLFLHRDLLVLPSTAAFVSGVDLMHRRGYPFIGHLAPEVGQFIRLIRGYFPDDLTPEKVNARLPTAISWVRAYLWDGTLPSLGAPFPAPTILDQASGGFVVAETTGSLPEAWFELYRQGYYQGVLFGGRRGSLLPALVARKSAFIPFDIERAALLLNEAEVLLGGIPAWAVEGDWLWSPPDGTLILATEVVRTLMRVRIPLFDLQ